MSRRPYWCAKTMKRRPRLCSKPVLWELNSFLIQMLYFVPINLHRCWPPEWKRSILGLKGWLPCCSWVRSGDTFEASLVTVTGSPLSPFCRNSGFDRGSWIRGWKAANILEKQHQHCGLTILWVFCLIPVKVKISWAWLGWLCTKKIMDEVLDELNASWVLTANTTTYNMFYRLKHTLQTFW